MRDYETIPAKVVSSSLDKANNFITIDKGSADGVRKDMGVVCGQGIVGIVYLCNEHYSVIIPVLNEQSNISCTIRGRGFFGYLALAWRFAGVGLRRGHSATCSLPFGRLRRYVGLLVGIPAGHHRRTYQACVQLRQRTLISS